MPVLASSKHEQFAQSIVRGLSATQAYVSAGYAKAGAQQSSARLRSNAKVGARIQELEEIIAKGLIRLEISSRNARVEALQHRWDRLRSGVDRLLKERGKDMLAVPGGSTGLLCRDYKGKDATQEIYRVDSGLIALLGEVRAHEEQAARELGQWVEKQESKAQVTTISIQDERLAALSDEELNAVTAIARKLGSDEHA